MASEADSPVEISVDGQLVFYASTTNPIDPKKVTRLALENAGSIAN